MTTGDIITCAVRDLPGIFHQGIIIKNGNQLFVFHCSPGSLNAYGGNVVIDSLKKFLENRRIVSVLKSEITIDDIYKCFDKLKSNKYSLFYFNCYDLVKACL